MHIRSVTLRPETYPTVTEYPFSLQLFRVPKALRMTTPVTFFVGENGTGTSALLEAIARRCGICIWKGTERTRCRYNSRERQLHRHLEVEWTSTHPGILQYYGSRSLLEQSHGQSHLAFLTGCLAIRGVYLIDEPENALSPQRQVELARFLNETARAGEVQYTIATHSPVFLALPGATIFSFGHPTTTAIDYEQTTHYRVYRDFPANRSAYLS